MNEEKLVNQIKELKTITPNSDWVLANKKELLGEEKSMNWNLLFKTTLVGASAFMFLAVLNISKNALPGDFLFALRKLGEKKSIVFSTPEERSLRSFELASKRLEELSLIAQNNEVKRISPAINEFQSTMEDVTREISRIYVTDQEINEDLIEKANELEEAKETVSRVLASEFGGEAYDQYEIGIARLKIKAAEDSVKQLRLIVLTEEDHNKLDEISSELELAKKHLDNEDYYSAFEIIDRSLEEIIQIKRDKQIQ